MPEEIKNRHEPIGPRRADLGRQRQPPAQGIGRRPRHARIAGQGGVQGGGKQREGKQGCAEGVASRSLLPGGTVVRRFAGEFVAFQLRRVP